MMNRRALTAALALLFVSGTVWAEGEPAGEGTGSVTATKLAVQADTSVASTYVFRGVPQYATRGVASSQSTLGLGMRGVGPGDFNLSLWNATALAPSASQPSTSLEFDVTASYGGRVARKVDVSGGYIAYLYPRAPVVDGAHEAFVTAALSEGIVTPHVGIYAETVRLEGAYATAGFNHLFEFGKVSVSPDLSAGVVGYRGINAHVNDVTASTTGRLALSSSFAVFARLAESYLPKPTTYMSSGDGSVSARFVPCAALGLAIASNP